MMSNSVDDVTDRHSQGQALRTMVGDQLGDLVAGT